MTEKKQTTLIIGASSAIGAAVIRELSPIANVASANSGIIAVSRSEAPDDFGASGATQTGRAWYICDYQDAAIEGVVKSIQAQLEQQAAALTRIIICNGVLHNSEQERALLLPEKRLEDLQGENFLDSIAVNTLLPLRWIQRLVALLDNKQECKIAVLSARVGSISDNQLGGWYSYRASKAALNMLLQTASVELARRKPGVKLIAFHPGTTDTPLSRPFQKNVRKEKLFSADFVADRLLDLMDATSADGKLSFIDWDGKPIDF
ncbi:MAG: SDR family NAD(P)-dependent oxidoreductase [Gammaproteobacteria bacterium]|nr:SDR family NAD(P)-dependent oxidoreductase [Gammaproteobacteria bacterium]NNM10539.1 SDR family NAD(P)-dependent oxidoreductase [Pseudomonadales bacterium]RZV52524.1 MAG: SDR family NAD(P)-dependent oxidoreductase [Pseudomonadales bacterium]